ncbi:MAG: ABC transporter permease subunit [Treponema sp.]|jgi:NitT/TauT family transport system permease protein|nr:ABC transporter permease subunit [Treponema sp.]
MPAKTGKLTAVLLPPVLFGAAFVLLGETRILHALLRVTEVQLPKTSSIMRVIVENFPRIVRDSWVTLQVFWAGIAIGCAAGFLTAIFATVFPRWGVGALTVISACNAIPIVALSPILRLWFSGSAFAAKTAVVAIVSMVAMSVNAYRGLTDLKPFALDLMESYAATKPAIFFKLRLPNCLPYIFIALRINIAAAMIGVIISEYFAASVEGLGFVIRNSLRTTQLTTGWAYILVASLLGILFFMLISFLEKKLMKNRG